MTVSWNLPAGETRESATGGYSGGRSGGAGCRTKPGCPWDAPNGPGKGPGGWGGFPVPFSMKGNRFDLGGHRFLTRIPEIEQLWQDLMGDDFLRVRRKSRILYQGRFLNYPLHFTNILVGLGLGESFLCLGSYLHSRFLPRGNPETLEGWITNRFGKRLFQKFFESYSEKVWGRPCRGNAVSLVGPAHTDTLFL